MRQLWSERRSERFLVVQKGENIDQAKVFKVHAVPQEICANLINALKLLVNQQEDGDDFIQKGHCDKPR